MRVLSQTATRRPQSWTVRPRSWNSSSWRRAPSPFFGTRRVVVLPEIDPAAYGSDKDLDELSSTLSSLENAVVVLGSVFPLERGKAQAGQAGAEAAIAQCKAIGYTGRIGKAPPL